MREKSVRRWWQLFSLIVLTLLVFPFISGCSVDEIRDWTNDKVALDQEELYSLASDPNGEGQKAVGEAGKKTREYYDEVTGLQVSRAQYYAYHITDAVKYYGWYIALPCFCVGFLVRRLVKGSASLRKLGLFLELWVPLIYILIAFVLSAVAGRIT